MNKLLVQWSSNRAMRCAEMSGALGIPWRTCQADKSRPEPHAQPVAYMRQRSGRDHCGCTTPAPRSDGGQPCGRTWEEKRHQRSLVDAHMAVLFSLPRDGLSILDDLC